MRPSLAALVDQRPCMPQLPTRCVRSLHALSIDEAMTRTLQARPFQGRVHSVFDRVVNLERDSGGLLTLACRALDNAPNTARLGLADFRDTGIGVDDIVTGGSDGVRIGHWIAVRFATASAWQARLPAYADGRLPAQLRLARAYLRRHGGAGGMVAARDGGTGFALAWTVMLDQRTRQLLDALSRADFESARPCAVSLLGLGPGLTPSGDDYLVGLFAVLNIDGSPCQGWLNGGTDVLADAAQLTHAISLAALTEAAGGRVRESIQTLIEALMHGTPESLVDPLHRVLAIGSSSGADLVAGILAGLELNLRVGAAWPGH
jgi:hypothetical protein